MRIFFHDKNMSHQQHVMNFFVAMTLLIIGMYFLNQGECRVDNKRKAEATILELNDIYNSDNATSLPFKLCGDGKWDLYSLSIDPYPIIRGSHANVQILTNSDHPVSNATEPPGYTLHIKILYEDFIEV